MFIAVFVILSIRWWSLVGIEAVREWRNWVREDPPVHPYRWLRPDLVPPAPFLQCKPCLTPGGSGILSDPNQIDAEFRKAWLSYFYRSRQREASLEEFPLEVEEWMPLLPVVSLPELTGEMLAEAVRPQGCHSWVVWMAGGWRELKVLPVSWFDGLARTPFQDWGDWCLAGGFAGCLYCNDPCD